MTAVRKGSAPALWEMDTKCFSSIWTVWQPSAGSSTMIALGGPNGTALPTSQIGRPCRPDRAHMDSAPPPHVDATLSAGMCGKSPPTMVRWCALRSPHQSAWVQPTEAESWEKRSPLSLSLSTLCLPSPSPFSLALCSCALSSAWCVGNLLGTFRVRH